MAEDSQLPAAARLVFTGVIFDVYHWKQTMYDGSTETFEMLKRPDTAVVITIVKDKILIQTQEQPGVAKAFPSLPGGRVNAGEDPLTGAKRELLEETGYTATDWALWQTYRPSHKIIWTIHVFVARDGAKTHAPKPDAGEKIITQLVSFDEFLLLADDPLFSEKELKETLLRARFIPAEKEKLRKILFGNND